MVHQYGRDRPLGLIDVMVVLTALPFIFGWVFALIGVRPPKGETWQYWILGFSSVLFLGGGALLLRRRFRKDVFRDWLTDSFGVPFECAGIHLVPVLAPRAPCPGGPVRYALFYQNRFEAEAQIEVSLAPGPRFLGRYDLPEAQWNLDVGPGEVGFVWKDFTLSDALTPGQLTLEFMAHGRRSRGRELRVRAGNALGNRRRSRLLAVAMLAVGRLFHMRQAQIGLWISAEQKGPISSAKPDGRLVIWKPGVTLQEAERALDVTHSIASLDTCEGCESED